MHSLVIFVLLIVQVLLAWAGLEVPGVFGALHPLNAFLILGAVGALTMREWRGDGWVARRRSRCAASVANRRLAARRHSGWLWACPPTRKGVVTPS